MNGSWLAEGRLSAVVIECVEASILRAPQAPPCGLLSQSLLQELGSLSFIFDNQNSHDQPA